MPHRTKVLCALLAFFGADEPNYATMKNGRLLLKELGQLAPGVFTSAPTTCCSGDGTPA